MGIPAYNYNGVTSGYDFASLVNNPYFQQAYISKNVNFKGSGSESVQQSPTTTTYASSSYTSNGAIPVTTQPQQSESGFGTAAAIGTTIVVGGGALCLIKKGKFGKAFEKLKSKVCGNGFTENANAALQKLTATKVNGKIRFMIPEKTITKQGADIQNIVSEYGIPSAISAERQAFKPASSIVQDFKYTVGSETFTIHIEDGAVKRIVDKDGNEILKRFTDAEVSSPDCSTYEKIQNTIKEFAKEKDIDKNFFDGVSNIHYTNTFGDDVLKMSQAKYGEPAILEEFTTLQRFGFNDQEMQSLVLNADEKVFANKKFWQDGKFVDGVTVTKFAEKLPGGYVGNFEGETLVSVVKPNGTILPRGSAGFEDIANQYEKDINKIIKNVVYNRKYIPEGATVVTG